LLAGCASTTPTVKRLSTAKPSEAAVWSESLRSDTLKNSYRIVLKRQDNSITGLCFVKRYDNEWRGTLINELGTKIFDFTVGDDKCMLLNVISMLDKGYIRKTLEDDLYILFNVDNPVSSFGSELERFEQDGVIVVNYRKKQILLLPDGSVALINNHNMRYELRKMVDIDRNKVIL
jgi:hypothetical protein